MRTRRAVIRSFRDMHGIAVRWVTPDGKISADAAGADAERIAGLDGLRAHAMAESVRWGEPYSFFLVPGLLSWMVPVVNGDEIVAGVTGTVRTDDESETERDAIIHLIGRGARPADARAFLASLPAWPQTRIQQAVSDLHELVYSVTGWRASLLDENRSRAAQQRQIAEEIQRRKLAQDYGHPVDEERRLLARIRAGDRKGARGALNGILGVMFLSSPNPVIIKARSVELLGYLVRAAVENSPHLEPLIARNHQWTARLITTVDFEDLTQVLGEALDDFMDNVYLLGVSSGNQAVRKALAFIADHFREPVTLEDVARAAGLSVHRTAHLLKDTTGHSFLKHLHRIRIEAACRMLEEDGASGAEVAYAVGYNDQSHFIRHFRRQTGMTPGQYARGRRRAAI